MTTTRVEFDKCRFCNSKFSDEILNVIKEDNKDVYCPNCGDLIKKLEFRPLSNSVLNDKAAHITPFIVSEPPQEFVIPTNALLYPNGRVFYDNDFPLIFNTNFIIVFARLVYFHALRLEKEGKIDLEELEIEDDLINDLHIRISPIHNERIKAEFVKNLHNITLNEFELNLKKLQRKFQDNRQYREDFIPYSCWLIKRVLTIISEKKPDEELTKFEFIIINDLRTLNLDNFRITSKPRKTTYEKYVELAKTREDLEFDMTREEFKKLLQNRGSVRPSWLKYRWRCTEYGHTWESTFNNIKNGTRCPNCPQKNSITYEDYLTLIEMREDVNVGMSRSEFYKALVNRGNTNPSEIKLKWMCSKKRHTWEASYHSIRKGYGCSRCPKGSKAITYKKCVELGNKRDDLSLDMTKEEFETAIAERGSIRPSSVKLRWKCTKFGHTWNTSYQHIYIGKGCAVCFSTSYEKCIELAESRDDLSFDMTREEFLNALNDRGSKVPNAIQLQWRCLVNSSHHWSASYNNIDSGNGCPFCGERVRIIGEQIHYIVEYLSKKYLKINNCHVNHEVEVSPNRKYRIDLMVERNKNFIDNIEKNQNFVDIPEKLKKVAIDFTFSLNLDKILKKCSKKYQNSERFLLIVLIREHRNNNAKEFQQQIVNSNNIQNKENIKITNYKDYLHFIGLIPGMDKWRALTKIEKKILTKFVWAKNIAINSIEFDSIFDDLIKAGNRYRNLLK